MYKRGCLKRGKNANSAANANLRKILTIDNHTVIKIQFA